MTTATYIRSTAVALAPLTVGCPKCLAGRGSHCRSAGGYQNSAVGFHAARRAAVAHLSEQQRYDAYAEMRAEETALRARVSARLRLPLTAAQVVSRRRTGEAWARIGRDAAAEQRAAQPARRPLSPVRSGGEVVDLAAARAERRGPAGNPDGVA